MRTPIRKAQLSRRAERLKEARLERERHERFRQYDPYRLLLQQSVIRITTDAEGRHTLMYGAVPVGEILKRFPLPKRFEEVADFIRYIRTVEDTFEGIHDY